MTKVSYKLPSKAIYLRFFLIKEYLNKGLLTFSDELKGLHCMLFKMENKIKGNNLKTKIWTAA